MSALYLPPWLVNYSYSVTPNVGRTPFRGKVQQRQYGPRKTIIADATRLLRYSELHFFEAMIREIYSDGAQKYNDYYADENGLVANGLVRIVDGAYDVSFDGRSGVVSCQLEVFS